MSLSDYIKRALPVRNYIKRDLAQATSAPSLQEIDERIWARGPSRVRAQTILEALREVRGG